MSSPTASTPPIRKALRDPPLAAVLAWLVPGLGHLYQGRIAKGLLFLICILGSYAYGFVLGERHVVYYSMRTDDRNYSFFCQLGVGLPGLFAIVQAYRVGDNKPALWGGVMKPPDIGVSNDDKSDERDEIYLRLHRSYELGRMYTMIAGLLNLLVVFDAFYGPVTFVELPVKNRKKASTVPEPEKAKAKA